MKKIIATAFAAGLVVAGLSVVPAYAAGDVSVDYGCNSATFTNTYSETVNVNYGTANSGDVVAVQVPAGKSVKVMAKVKNFGYTATLPNGAEVGILEWPGVDLTAKCSDEERDEQGKLFTVEYGCNSATFTNNTGGHVTLDYGQKNSGDTNRTTIYNTQSRKITSTADNFGWLAKDAEGRTVNVEEGGIDLTAKCAPTNRPTTPRTTAPGAPRTPKENRGGLAKTGV
ncbi:hypothetical protein [Granulicoccus sp. GXG6511]|uniref:hypothetical protein n=1 Tax=Granulicoccus sp. GXG6511 TaxID=3381351 RepID=UPI003D7DE2D6